MSSVRDDLVKLSDYAGGRLRDRMVGLTDAEYLDAEYLDAEYLWEPVPNCRTVRPVAGGTYRSGRPRRADPSRRRGGAAARSLSGQ